MASHGRFSPLRSPRRILTALAVAVLLGGTAVGVVGMAAADDADGLFALPERMAGDRVQYRSFEEAEHHPDGEHEDTFLQGQMIAWKDPNGAWHATDVVSMVWGFTFFGEEHEVHFPSLADATTLDPLAAAMGAGSGYSSSTSLLGGSETSTQQNQRLSFDASWHPCGFVNSLQGAPAGSKTLKTVGWCGLGEPGPATFTFDRHTTYKDAPALVYTGPNGTELTFAQGIPYPVQTTVPLSGPSALVGLEHGREALQWPDVPETGVPLPPVGQAPADRMGPSMEGVELTYPLGQAFQEARGDPGFTELSSYLERNPDWYVHDAQYQEEGEEQRWFIDLTAPDEGLSLMLIRHPSTLAQVSPVPVPEDLAWDVQRAGFERDGGDGLPLSELPAEQPSMGDVAAGWQAYAERDDAPPVVGFRLPTCFTHGCSEPSYFAGLVGTHSYASSGSIADALFGPPVATSSEGVTVAYDRNGTLESIWLGQTTYERSGGPLAPPQPTQAPSDDGPGVTQAGIPWSPPPGETAAGITLVSLLVALGYYVWPLAKGLPLVGLWSRRRGGTDLLDHPMRRSLYDHIKSDPGVHYQQLVRQVGRGQGVVEHHLRRLQDGGLVSTVRRDGYVCHFPAGRIDRRAMAAAPALRSDGARAILAAVQAAPGASVKDVAQATGLSPGTVTYHLRRLRETGAIESARNGRTVRLHAADWMT